MNSLLSTIKEKTNIFFVRHAESVYNKKNLIAGQAETPLTKKGIEQAKTTGGFLAQHNISVILHSPLIRTKQTATYITHQFSTTPPLVVCDCLIEIGTGVFTHKTLAEIEHTDPTAYYRFKIHSWDSVDQSEKITSLISRCLNTWSTIVEYAHKGHTNILVVSHGGFMHWIFKTSFGLEGQHLQSWSPVIRSKNCGMFQLVIDPITYKNETGVYGFWNLLNHVCYN